MAKLAGRIVLLINNTRKKKARPILVSNNAGGSRGRLLQQTATSVSGVLCMLDNVLSPGSGGHIVQSDVHAILGYGADLVGLLLIKYDRHLRFSAQY